jgi:hypothetical protein
MWHKTVKTEGECKLSDAPATPLSPLLPLRPRLPLLALRPGKPGVPTRPREPLSPREPSAVDRPLLPARAHVSVEVMRRKEKRGERERERERERAYLHSTRRCCLEHRKQSLQAARDTKTAPTLCAQATRGAVEPHSALHALQAVHAVDTRVTCSSMRSPLAKGKRELSKVRQGQRHCMHVCAHP